MRQGNEGEDEKTGLIMTEKLTVITLHHEVQWKACECEYD